MGREKRRKSLSLAFLLPITPRAPLERDRERRLGTSKYKTVLNCGFHAVDSGLQGLDYGFLTVELGLQIPIASGIPDSTSKNFPDSGDRITFHLAYTEKNRDQYEPTILDKSPWDSTAIFIFFSVPS